MNFLAKSGNWYFPLIDTSWEVANKIAKSCDPAQEYVYQVLLQDTEVARKHAREFMQWHTAAEQYHKVEYLFL